MWTFWRWETTVWQNVTWLGNLRWQFSWKSSPIITWLGRFWRTRFKVKTAVDTFWAFFAKICLLLILTFGHTDDPCDWEMFNQQTDTSVDQMQFGQSCFLSRESAKNNYFLQTELKCTWNIYGTVQMFRFIAIRYSIIYLRRK